MKYFFKSIWYLFSRLPFTAYNFIVPAWTIFALITLSGLNYTKNEYVKENAYFLNFILFISYWYPIIIAAEIGLLLLINYYQQRNKNWWNLSLIVEIVKESYAFRSSMGIIGLTVLVCQVYAWIECPSELKDCKLDFYPRASTPVPFEKYQELVSFMKDSDCYEYNYDIDSLIPQNITSQTNQTINPDTYLEVQEECYRLTDICKPYCSDRSTLVNFLFSLVTGGWGLIFLVIYDGPHHVGTPHHLKVFDKLRIPKWYCLPAFWSSPSELIQLLLPILVIQQSCKGDQEEFEYLKEKYSDLPWDWVREFTEKDFEELKAILPQEQRTISPVWEITGPISKLYKPLNQLREINQLEGNNLLHSLKISFVIWFEEPVHIAGQEEQIKVSVFCKEKRTWFGGNVIQFELSDLQNRMGLGNEDYVGIKFKKVNIPKFLEKKNWKNFDDQKNVMKFFPTFLSQKIQLEQQSKQELEICVVPIATKDNDQLVWALNQEQFTACNPLYNIFGEVLFCQGPLASLKMINKSYYLYA